MAGDRRRADGEPLIVTPVTIDVPHQLGRDEAKARIQARTGELAGHIPGGAADVTTSWPDPYEMALEISALGAIVQARLEVQDRLVRVHLLLPALLAFFSGMIGTAVKDAGGRLLESGDSTRAPPPR